MGNKKKEIRIIKNDSNKGDYTFVSSNILKYKKNKESINNEIKSETKPNNRIEKKIHTNKVDNKGRKILGKVCKVIPPYMNNHISEYKLPKN